ncbi:MAG: DUF4340 domain-containing protein [Chloroflexi bacterium]|nr:DUF4340 domain-containing protein [Chloroflexota bacterium]
MNRRNLILLATLLAQVVLILLLATWRAPAASGAAKPLLENVTAAGITQLAIQDQDGNRIELARSGDGWVLPQSDDYPVVTATVSALLDKLVGIQTGRLIANTATGFDRLQVSDSNYVRRVELKLADGGTRTLFVGSSPSGGAVHVRLDGANGVYLTDSLSSADAGTDAASWIDTAFFTVTLDQLSTVTLANQNGTFTFEKEGSDWKMKGLAAGEELDAQKVTDLLTPLSALTMRRPLGKTLKPEYGLQPPSATITLTAKSDAASPVPKVLTIGALDATDSTYAAGASGSAYYARVSSVSVGSLVTSSKQDFLKLPPTPEATVAPSATP